MAGWLMDVLEARMPAGFRALPHDIEVEQALIGAILVNNEAYDRVADFLRPEHFYEPVHATMFGYMARAIGEGRRVDHVLMAHAFEAEPSLAELGGGRQYLARITRSAEAIINAEDYGRYIHQLAVRRGLINVGEDAVNKAYDLSQGVAVNGQIYHLRESLEILEREQAPLTGSAMVMFAQCRVDLEAFYQIDGILPRCNMVLVYGYGGCGKTYLSTSLAIGIGSGRWFTHETEVGAVLYCAFERPQDAEDRLAALRKELNCANLSIALLKLGGRKLDDQTAALILSSARTLAQQTGHPVRMIMIDTVSAALGGTKEDDEGFGRLKTIGERLHAETGAMVAWVHHEGKSEGRGPRGALQLADACTVWWRVEEREDGSRVVHAEKANRGPCHQPLFAFKLAPFSAGIDTKGRDIPLCKLEITGLEDALASPVRKRFDPKPVNGGHEPRLGKNQKLMLRCLLRLYKRHPDGVERNLLRSMFLMELKAERQASGQESMTPNTGGSVFRRALLNVCDAGLVIQEDDLFRPAETNDRCR